MKQLTIILCGLIILNSCNTAPCQFNIDKLEIMAGFNVPKLDDGIYYCNQIENVKISVMDIAVDKLTEGTIDDYFERYAFIQNPTMRPNQLSSWENLPDEFKDIVPEESDFYVKQGDQKEVAWTVLIERNTGYMWAEVIYKE